MKLSRRELAAAAVAVVAPSGEAQNPPAATSDIAQVVHDANRRNAEALARFEIPVSTEPAFQFKA